MSNALYQTTEAYVTIGWITVETLHWRLACASIKNIESLSGFFDRFFNMNNKR